MAPFGRKKRSRQSKNVPAPTTAPPPLTIENQNILEAFVYGRALATSLSRKLSEGLVDLVSGINKAIEERPIRLQEFQEEVMLLAQQEMEKASVSHSKAAHSDITSSSSSSSYSNPASAEAVAARAAGPAYLQAMVEEMRADVAYSRAIIQQIKATGSSESSSLQQ